MNSSRNLRPDRAAAAAVFDRVLVGVDGTPEGFDACRQVALLARDDAFLEAAMVAQLAPGLTEEREQAAATTLATARELLGPHARTQPLYGLVVPQLLDEAKAAGATLLAVGTRGYSRIEEIVFGGVAGELLHLAPCSVLLARSLPDLDGFPGRIVVGLDGSEGAEHAYAVAQTIARRRRSSLRGIVALGGKRVDIGSIAHRHPRVETSGQGAVRTLVDASAAADLVVLGSRGLHGPRALGSVSERVAHQAACSVLVVRPA